MTIHRKYFFDYLRANLFDSFSQDQVNGLNVFLDWYDMSNPPIPDAHHLGDREMGYVLATTYHETAATMQPIAEYGKGKGKPYGKPSGPWGQTYYGRGYVQLTWYDNYSRQDEKLRLQGELIRKADRALDPEIALLIILGGMSDGDFTGKKLGDYFTDELTDWYNARRIVNGTDQATLIAEYADTFCSALAHV